MELPIFGEHVFKKHSENITDLPNRFVFYPLARLMLPSVARTRITPTQITVIHMVLAIIGAALVLVGTKWAFMTAFALFFVRAILDCLDGALARYKNMTSMIGRTMDQAADSVAFIALCVTLWLHFQKTVPEYPATMALASLFLVAMFTAGTWDFYRRRIVSALRTGRDCVINDLVEKHRLLRRSEADLMVYFGLFLEWLQIIIYAPQTIPYIFRKIREPAETINSQNLSLPEPEAAYVLERNDTMAFKVLLWAIAFICGDNIFFIFTLGLLSDTPSDFIAYCLFYAAGTLFFGIIYINYFLRGLRKFTATR